MPRPKAKTYSKYRSIRTEVDGIKFHSKVEARRYIDLKRQQQQGRIDGLRLQPRYKIQHPLTGKLICTYVADFTYERDGVTVIEDVKGVLTDTYRLKKKLMRLINDLHITEVKAHRVARGTYVWCVDGVIEEGS